MEEIEMKIEINEDGKDLNKFPVTAERSGALPDPTRPDGWCFFVV